MDDDLWNDDFFQDEPMEVDIGHVDESIEQNVTSKSAVKRPAENLDDENRPQISLEPLDWFKNIQVKGNDVKRRKMEQNELIFKMNARKIEEARLKKLAIFEALNTSEKIKNGQGKVYLLDMPPMTGENWFGINSPDTFHRRYLSCRSEEYSGIQEPKLKSDNKKLREIIQKLRFEHTFEKDYEPERPILPRKSSKQQLWIDKYAAKSYMDLLTEDKTNLMALTWLSLWNEYIFKTPSKYEKLNQYEQSLFEIEDVKPFLPKKKIMMIHGPPGCGKTSLALMVAKIHYDPFLINMSEIVNVNDLNRILQLALNFHAISFVIKERKPRCIIVDGLEYATTEMVSLLLKWMSEKKKKDSLRPIICTCNNLYAISLKDLRLNSFNLKSTIDESRILKRIQNICFKENISVSNLTLNNFVTNSNGDIRLCLNMLQFQCDSAYSDTTMKRIDLQHKTETKIFDAIETILFLNKHKDKQGNLQSPKERFQKITQIATTRPDFDRFFQIIFQNLPELCKTIPKKLAIASKNFVENDLIGTMAYSHQDFTLLTYLQYGLVEIHFILSKTLHNRPNISLSVTNVHERQRQIFTILTNLRMSKANLQLHLGILRLLIDILPPLVYILQPPLNIDSSLMFKAEGLESVNKIVKIMEMFGLNLNKKIGKNNQLDDHFDPPIDEITGFTLEFRPYKPSLPPSAKTFIVRQLEMTSISNNVNENEEKSNENMSKRNLRNSNYMPQNDNPWLFKYYTATSQTIKKNIKIGQLFMV